MFFCFKSQHKKVFLYDVLFSLVVLYSQLGVSVINEMCFPSSNVFAHCCLAPFCFGFCFVSEKYKCCSIWVVYNLLSLFPGWNYLQIRALCVINVLRTRLSQIGFQRICVALTWSRLHIWTSHHGKDKSVQVSSSHPDAV